jgi:hypothetical protein
MEKPTRDQLEKAGGVLSLMYLGRIVGLLGTQLRPIRDLGISSEDVDTLREVAHAGRWDWRLGHYVLFDQTSARYKEVRDRILNLDEAMHDNVRIWKVSAGVADCVLTGCNVADKHREGELDRTGFEHGIFDLVETAQRGVDRLPDDRLKDAAWDCFDMVKEGLT